jgi:hypothetical protein
MRVGRELHRPELHGRVRPQSALASSSRSRPPSIAITQIRIDARDRAYLDHRRAAGDTKTEAIRALRRRISDDILRRLSVDETARSLGLTAAA